jgi:hypothetical protein
VRRIVFALLISLSLFGEGGLANADDMASSDYRVRMGAALVLGRSTEPSARKDLERALNDAHPAVRAAAAGSLSKVGDQGSLVALKARLLAESEESVKTQLSRSVAAIEARRERKLFVQVGSMRNASKVGSADLSKIASGAVRTHATKFAEIVESEDSEAVAIAVSKKSRVVRLDGEIRSVSQSKKGGVMSVRAQVEFSVLQLPGKTLKGTLSGAATSRDPNVSLAALQELAVRGAVESAIANAGPGLLAVLD